MKKSILLFLWGVLATNILCMTGYNSSNNVDASDLYFPVTKEAFVDYPNALTYGTLIFDGKYLLIKGISPTSGADYLPIWPYGYSVNVKGDEIWVLDGNGKVVACTGDSIKVGGGETTREVVEENYIGEPLSNGYDGSYWLVSKVTND